MHARVAHILILSVLFAAGAAAEPQEWTLEQQAVIDAVSNGPLGTETDFDSWANGYSGDWTYWRVGDRTLRPRETHMALVREYIDAGNKPTAFDLEPIDVVIRGNVAMLRLIATETLLGHEGDTRVVRYASATMLTREDGRWKTLATNIVYIDD